MSNNLVADRNLEKDLVFPAQVAYNNRIVGFKFKNDAKYLHGFQYIMQNGDVTNYPVPSYREGD